MSAAKRYLPKYVGGRARCVGSLLNVGAVQIGTSGAATLSVSDGARIVTTGAVSVATNAAGMGTIVVSGAGSRLNVTGALNTSAGEGWITVADAGVIVTTAASTISPTGRVTLDGGRWETSAATNAALSVGGLLQGAGVVEPSAKVKVRGIARLALSPDESTLVGTGRKKQAPRRALRVPLCHLLHPLALVSRPFATTAGTPTSTAA